MIKKTRYQITWSGVMSDYYWNNGWVCTTVLRRFPFPIIYKWTKHGKTDALTK